MVKQILAWLVRHSRLVTHTLKPSDEATVFWWNSGLRRISTHIALHILWHLQPINGEVDWRVQQRVCFNLEAQMWQKTFVPIDPPAASWSSNRRFHLMPSLITPWPLAKSKKKYAATEPLIAMCKFRIANSPRISLESRCASWLHGLRLLLPGQSFWWKLQPFIICHAQPCPKNAATCKIDWGGKQNKKLRSRKI